MLSGLESGIGLDIVIWLQAHGSPFLDMLATLLHWMGLNPLLAVVGVLIYLLVDRPLGLRLLVGLALSIVIINGLKFTLIAPRPYQAFPDRVTALVIQDGYGIPSGHVFDAVFLWGYAALWFNRKKANRRLLWFVAGYTVVVAWSRMYAGVHYPQDVMAGLILGLMMVYIYWRYTKPVPEAQTE